MCLVHVLRAMRDVEVVRVCGLYECGVCLYQLWHMLYVVLSDMVYVGVYAVSVGAMCRLCRVYLCEIYICRCTSVCGIGV